MSKIVCLVLALLSTVDIALGIALCDKPADIAFVIDSSVSIKKEDFEKQIEFVQELVNTFNIGADTIHVAALKFSNEVANEFYFNDVISAKEASGRIAKITHAQGDATNTHSALEAMRKDLFSPSNGARTDVSKVCVLLTDGQSTNPWDTPEQARLAKAAGIKIVAIGIGDEVNDAQLEDVVSSPASENYVRASSFSDLKSKLYLIGKTTCKVITTQAPPPPPPTTEPKDRPDDACQGKEADVLFVVDMSNSIWPTHFNEQLQFLNDIVSFFDINGRKTRVGLVAFSDNAKVQFYFDSYNTQADISTAILAVTQEGGITNTHLALQTAADEMFTAKHGSRRGVAHICIVITDGESRYPQQTISAANMVHKLGVDVFAIGVGNDPNITELRHIASRPQFVYRVNGYGALREIKNILAVKACEDTTPPPKPIPDEPEEICRGEREDVVFVVDMSNSIWIIDFEAQLTFLSKLVSFFDIDNGNTKVGMMTFSTDTTVQFYLDAYGNKEEIKRAILAVKTEGGVTNTHLALKRLREEMLTKKHGLRPDVNQICIVITDGISKQPKQTAIEADLVHKTGADIIAIGVGDKIDEAELSEIASKPNFVFKASGYDTLQDIKNVIAETTCKVPLA